MRAITAFSGERRRLANDFLWLHTKGFGEAPKPAREACAPQNWNRLLEKLRDYELSGKKLPGCGTGLWPLRLR